MEKQTKKQHYVPQFYLRQWTDELNGFYPIKIIDKHPPFLKIIDKKSGPRSFCFENYFYAQHTGVKDEISQTIEKAFSEIEAVFHERLSELEQKILNNQKITEQDKYHLCECMLFLYFRGKKYREQSQEMLEGLIKEISKGMFKHSEPSAEILLEMKKHGLTKEDMVDFTEKGEYSVRFGNMQHLKIMKEMYGFCNILHSKYWKVLVSRDGDFITTDTPYQDISTSNHFWGNDFISREQRFVLSPRIVIFAIRPINKSGKKFHRKDITQKKDTIYMINSSILMNSIRFGFHKDREVLIKTQKVTAFLSEASRRVI